MVYRFFYTAIFLGLAWPLAYADDVAKPPYKITLKRSYTVGMKTREAITISSRTSIKVGDAAPNVSQQDLTVECDIQVIKLDNGHWKQLEVAVTSVDATAKGTEPVFTALNLPITAIRDGGIVSFRRVDGKPLPVTDIKVLKTCFVPAGKQTPDDLVGTDALQSPGDSWPVNADNLCKQLATISDGTMTCTPENTNGSMKLFRVWNLKDQTYLQVGGTTTYDPLTLSGPNFQQLSEPVAKASLTLSYQLPTDPALPAAKMEEAFSLMVTGKQTTAAGTELVEFKATSSKTRRLTVLETPTQTK